MGTEQSVSERERNTIRIEDAICIFSSLVDKNKT